MKLYYYSKQLKQEGNEARVDIERKIKSPEIELRKYRISRDGDC